MLRRIQEIEDAERLARMIPMIRAGIDACSVPDILFVDRCVEDGLYLNEQLLGDIPQVCASPGDAWIAGNMYCWGYGADENHSKAIDILKRHQDDNHCAALLGYIYLCGDLETRNVEQGRELLIRSSKAGCADAMWTFSIVIDSGYLSNVKNPIERVLKLIRRAAALSHPRALCSMAEFHYDTTHRNVKLALEFAEKAAAFGEPLAWILLGKIYKKGIGVERNRRKAAFMFRKAVIYGGENMLYTLDDADRIPWGEWYPDPLMHKYVPRRVHHAIRTVLLMHARKGSLFSMMPKGIVLSICFWICTHPEKAPKEDPFLMAILRQNKQLTRHIQQLECKLDQVLSMCL